MNTNRILLSAVALGLSLAWAAQAIAAPGEMWEMTTKMEMPGMPFAMPATTTKVCIPKGSEQDPKYSSDKECQVTDVKHSGNKTNWTVRCNRKGEVMTGIGEMSGSADQMEGKIRLTGTSEGQKVDMNMSYSNKRLGQACDSEEQTKKIMAQVCDTSTYDTQQWIVSGDRFLKDNTCPGKKEQLCAVVRKEVPVNVDAFAQYVQAEKANGGLMGKACGVNLEATTKAMCKNFNGKNAGALTASCPAQAKAYRENERRKACEGRSFTSKEDLSNCLAGKDGATTEIDDAPPGATAAKGNTKKAGATSEVQQPAAPAEQPNPAAAAIDAAKKLKGLFGL